MKSNEIGHILIAIIILTLAAGLESIIASQWEKLILIFAFSAIIILIAVFTKKLAAYLLDSDIEHEIWNISPSSLNLGWHILSGKKSAPFKKPLPIGFLLPLLISIIFLGTIKLTTLLTYETRALKYRASKRFGFYSYTSMTDLHNGLIGAAGTISLLIIAALAYLTDLGELAKLSIYYTFWNILPISKLDGAQIFFGSRILWSILASITTIAAILAIITV